jgi:hypothetical protein
MCTAVITSDLVWILLNLEFSPCESDKDQGQNFQDRF